MSTIQKVLLFSGGRTSGYMLRRQLDACPNFHRDFVTAFNNTGKERNETLDFVHEVEQRWSVPIVWLEYTRVLASSLPPGILPTLRRNQNLAKAAAKGEHTHWFRQVTYETASRNGEPFDELLHWASVLPNVRARICSTQLKVRSTMRYLFSKGVHQYAPYIGIRADEAHRSIEILNSCDVFEHPAFPLIESGIDEAAVLAFWNSNNFDLQLQPYEGNCDLCFLKKKEKRVRIAREHPERVAWWKGWEAVRGATTTGDGGLFRRGQPYIEIERLAQTEPVFTSNDEDIACTCVEKAFSKEDDE